MSKITPVIVFDSDKFANEAVMKAEFSLIDKIFKETNIISEILDLPQQFEGKTTKGFDDFLVHAGFNGFVNLKTRDADSHFLRMHNKPGIPLMPNNAAPSIYQGYLDQVQDRYEGCFEIAPLALFCQGAVVLGNSFEFNGKRPNFYGFGVSETTSGKSAVAKAVLKPLRQLNLQRHEEYKKNDTDNPKSRKLLMSQFTEEGLHTLMADHLERPVILSFDTEEFDNFFRKFSRDYNSSLSSFITKAYGADDLELTATQEALRGKKKLPTAIKNPSLSLGGVTTITSLLESLPKNSQETGFANRFPIFIGRNRTDRIVVELKPIDKKLEEKMLQMLELIQDFSFSRKKATQCYLSEEAKRSYSEFYIQFRLWEINDPINKIGPSCRRIVCDYVFKLAMQFEIFNIVEEILENSKANNHLKYLEEFIGNKLMLNTKAIKWAISWAKYLMQTSSYFFNEFLNEDTKFDQKVIEAIRILEKYSQGLLSSELRRKLKLHYKGKGEEYQNLLECLIEQNIIGLKEGKRKNSKIVFLKSHLQDDTVTV